MAAMVATQALAPPWWRLVAVAVLSVPTVWLAAVAAAVAAHLVALAVLAALAQLAKATVVAPRPPRIVQVAVAVQAALEAVALQAEPVVLVWRLIFLANP